MYAKKPKIRNRVVVVISLLGMLVLCVSCVLTGYLFSSRQKPTQIIEHEFPLQHKWCFEATEELKSTPVRYNDQVFVRTNKNLFAVDITTGELLWSNSLPLPSFPNPFLSPPLIQSNIVVVTRENDSYAFRTETGEQIWYAKSNHSSNRRTYPTYIDDQVVVIVSHTIEVRNLQNGNLLWEIDRIESRHDPIAIIEDGYVYVFFRVQVRVFEVKTGNQVRRMPLDSWTAKGRFFDDGVFYFENDFGGVSAFDVRSRKTLWKHNDLPPVDYPMAKDGEKLVVGLFNSHPIAINAITGETIWQAQDLPVDIYQTPLIMENTVYVRNLSHKAIYALDLQSGDSIGYLELGDPPLITTIPDFSLGPIGAGTSIIFVVDHMLCAYGR